MASSVARCSWRKSRPFLMFRFSSMRWYTLALTRQVSPRFADAVSMSSLHDAISLATAQQQHHNYVQCLQQLVAVQDLPPLMDQPDCCFVEDTVVAIGRTALVMRMGHASREQEVDSIKEVLENLPGLKQVQDMRTLSDTATCDGGDVLFTGRHVFVGVSGRTNVEGVEIMQNVFGNCEVIPVPMQQLGALHLKSLVTHMDSHTLVAPTGEIGDALLNEMKADERGYEVVRLPNVLACNVVTVNGTVLAQDVPCKESKERLQEAAEENNLRLVFVDTSEFAKVDGALTCCSVLLDV